MSQEKNLSPKSSRTVSHTGTRVRSVGMIALFAALLLIAMFWLVAAPSSQAQMSIYYVTPGGTGSSCSTAVPCALHTAVSQAVTGDEVRVSAGTYTRPGVGANVVLTLTQSITLSGGYDAGAWANPPDPDVNLTVLDGEDSVSVLRIENNASPTVQNFTIRNGSAQFSSGAGVHVASGSPLIRFNRIFSNTVDGNPAAGIFDEGGAMVVENEIFDNQATGGASGGGIVVDNGGGLTTIRLNEIYNNSAANSGGGILIQSGANAFLEANTVHDNTAASGGGFYAFGQTTLYSNLFYQNTASDGGGLGFSANATLWNNTVAGNTGTNDGGGILVFGSVITVSNTIVAFNSSGGFDGVALPSGGAASGGYNNIPDTSDPGASFTNLTTTDPDFVNPGTGNYHINSTSPNRDSGDPATPAGVNIDIDGRPRPVNGTMDRGADEYEPGVYNASLEPGFLNDSVDRGMTVIYNQHTLENTGTVSDTYTFSCSNSLNWSVTCPGPITLQSGEFAPVNFSVIVPGGATALSQATTIITASSQFSATLQPRAVIQSTVNPQPGVAFTRNFSDTVLPGDVITFTHIVTNTGDSVETFLIQKTAGNWGELLPTDSFPIVLAQGDSQAIRVRVTVPPDAPAGLEDITVVRASSQFDPGIFAEVSDQVIARPTIGTRYVALGGGNDLNNNCTQSNNPCFSIGHAVGQASSNDEVRIATGDPYSESAIPINDTIHLSGGWVVPGFQTQAEPETTVINAGGTSLIFDIAPGGSIQPTISNLTLAGGNNGGPGGAVLVGAGAQPQFEQVIFRGNQGTRGGALYAGANAFVSIRESRFVSNTATNSGGAVYVETGTLSIQQSTFMTNTAAAAGGAVYLVGGLLDATNNLFLGNDASSDGGGVYIANGLASSVVLLNNTMLQNQAGGDGGAVYNDAAQNVEIINTLLVNNSAAGSGGAVFQELSSGSTVVSYSDIWQNSTPETANVTLGTGNFTTDPLFADAQFRLDRGSPALDAGNPSLAVSPLVDFEGDPRPADAGFDVGYDELAGCRAQRDGIAQPFGSIQEAMVPDVPSQLIRVTGICRGVNQATIGGGQTVSQTVFITRSFTIQGGWNNDFTSQTGATTVIDPEGLGRGIYVLGPVTPTLESLTIINGDSAGMGGGPAGEDAGGGVYNDSGYTILVDMSILSNTAVLGGGFYNSTGQPTFRSVAQTPVDVNPTSRVGNNRATQAGGGIYNHQGSIQIDSLRLYSNTAVLGGAFYNHTSGTAIVTNTVVYSNTAANHGAGFYNAGSGNYWHLTFFRNDAGGNGGGFYNGGGTPLLRNAIFQDNDATNGSAIFVGSGDPAVDHNYYHNNTGADTVNPDAGDDNNSLFNDVVPPGLVDPFGGNFHLLDTAAVLDQGDPASPILADIDGEPRPADQGPDIGADELVGCVVLLNGVTYGSIQAALGDAQPGDTLQVSGTCSGVHDYDTGTGGANPCGGSTGVIQATVHLTRNINLQGGWDPQFSGQTQPTYLDAQKLGRVIHVAPGVTSTIEGFHILNGQIDNGAGICVDNASPTIQNNHFYSHTATNGAAVYTFDSPAVVNGNRIYLNDASSGAVYADSGAGISTILQNNFVYSNTAANGAAFYNGAGNNSFWHNTIYGNNASSRGGAFYMAAATPAFQNNIVLSNTAGIEADGAYGAAGSNPQDFNYNNFFGQSDDFGGTIASGGAGHIPVDPLLQNVAALNFSLPYTSPVAEAGTSVPVVVDFEQDIRPSHQGYDMGADEFGGCYARNSSDPDTIYGSVQLAVSSAARGDTVDVDGTCLGVSSRTLPATSLQITQSVFITRDLTLNGDWDYQTNLTATLNARAGGRVLYINSATTVTVTNIILRDGNAYFGGRVPAGGGIWNDGDLILINASIISNTAQSGGGLYNVTNVTMRDSLLRRNAAVNGGGFYNDAGGMTADLHGGNRFTDNRADNGGAVYQFDGILFLNGNRLYGNSATNGGGAVFLTGGTDDTIDLINNFIYKNSATDGAGLYNANTDARIWHNTVVSNTGGGLYNASSAVNFTVHSNIFDGNSGPGIESTVAADFDYNNVYNNSPNYVSPAAPGPNDIASPTIYVDPARDDYHIQETSPGVDDGDPNIPAGDNLTSDIDGDLRPTNQAPDIGADEFNSCLIRVINPLDSSETIFGVLQDAILYAESFAGLAPLPTVEIARGACRGVKTVGGTRQVGYITEDLTILGSLRRTNFSQPSPPDWNNINVGANSTVIDAQGEGRALYIAGNASVTLIHVALVNGDAYNANDTNNNGGALYYNGSGPLTTSESQACSSYAENGGGYFFGSQASAYISGANTGRCWIARFDDNDQLILPYDYYPGDIAQNNGGGMYVSSGAAVDIVNHSFRLNEAVTGDGGALYNADNQTRLVNVYVTLNDATSGNGGGIYNSGGVELYHNTIVGNVAANEGGAVYHAGSNFVMNSTIVYANDAVGGTWGGIFSSGGGTFDYNLFFGNLPDDSNIGFGTNFINQDPQLFGSVLSIYSPAIDQADAQLLNPGVWFGPVDFDAGNYKRPDVLPDYPDLNKGFTGYASDIGADEYWKEFGCDVKPDTLNSTVLPGDQVTYTVEIINVGNPSKLEPNAISHGYTDSFTITLQTTNPDWNIVLDGENQRTGKLDWYEFGSSSPDRVSAVLTVTVPATATIGQQEVSTIRCTSVSRPSQTGTAVATTNVGQVNGIIVAPEYITVARPGDVLTFTHYVTITGNTPETVLLVPNAGASGLSTAELISTSLGITNLVDLDVGEFITTYLRVTILDTAVGGGLATPGLIARSTVNPGVEGRAINQIFVQPVTGTRHVAVGGTNLGNNCLDPQQPCATIDYAVEQAIDGDTVLVAAGTYTDLITRTVAPNTFEQVVYVDKSVTIRGGYSVSENPPFTTMAPITNATILDGEQQHRLFTLADGITVTLSGLFLQNGFAYDSTGTSVDTQTDYGGSIYNTGANLTITSTWIISGGARYGSGLYHLDGDLAVHNSVFANGDTGVSSSGLAGNGAGISVVSGTVLLENNTFAYNSVAATSRGGQAILADGDGAAVHHTGGPLTLINNIFAYNNTDVTGASYSTIFASNPGAVTNDYNLYYSNTPTTTAETNFPPGANAVTGASPDFEDQFFHIAATSAAKDAGTSSVSSASGIDFELDTRPQGTDYDIGADERVQVPSFIFVPAAQTTIVDPGVPHVYTHYITNTGDSPDTYTLSYTSSSVSGGGWQHQVTPATPISLNIGEGAVVMLTITGTVPGDIDTTVITATPQTPNLLPQSVVDTTVVSSTLGVEIAPDRSGMAGPGTAIVYNHTLTNTGNGLAQYNIITRTAVPAGWTMSINPAQTGFLTPTGTTPFTVTVNVPPGTPAATVHQVQVEAYAVLDPAVLDVLTDTTTVSAAYGLLLTPDNVGSGPENSVVTYYHTLANVGNIDDSYVLSVAGVPASWAVNVQPVNTTVLPPQAAIPVTVTVSIPTGATGQTHVVTVTATSNGSALTATAVNTTTVQEQRGVVIAPDNFGVTDANTSVTYNHTVTNTGNVTDTFTLSASSTQGWLSAFAPATLNLASGATAQVVVTVTVPAGAQPGAQDVTTITATSDTDPTATDSATDTTRVRQQHGLAFTPDNAGQTNPGTTIAYTHFLTNTGNAPDQFQISANSSQGWAVAVPPNINLNNGASATVVVTLTVPLGTQGLTDLMVVTATSTISNAFFATVQNTTVVSQTQGALNVSITPDNSGSGLPNDTLTYQHVVENTGTISGSFTLTTVSSQGWSFTLTPVSITDLQPGNTVPVTVTVTIPAGAQQGVQDVTTVTVTDVGATVSDSAVNTTTVDLAPALGVQIGPDNNAFGVPGNTVTYTHFVTNTGSLADTYDLTAGSGGGWVTGVSPTAVALQPGASAPVTVTVTIPGGVTNGTLDTTVVTATSQTAGSVFDTANDVTIVQIQGMGVLIEPDGQQTGLPGDTIVYQHVLTNTSAVAHTFLLSVQSSRGWPITVTPLRHDNVAPGEARPVTVTVDIPITAANNDEDFATVVATSVVSTSITDLALDRTRVAINYGVAIEPDNSGSGAAGDTVSYQHTVTNTGNFTETIALSALSSQGWAVTVLPPSITLAGGQSGTVSVRVTIPLGTPAATVDNTTVTAATTTPGTSAVDTAVDTTTVSGAPPTGIMLYMPVIFGTPVSTPGVSITPDNSGSALAGNTLTYQHTVRNTGNSTDSFNVAAVSSQGWSTSVNPPTIFNLAAGGTQTVQVLVTIPGSAAAGTVDVTTVTATNVGGSVSDTARDTTTVDAVSSVDVSITPDNSRTAPPGTSAFYQHTVTNVGNTAETYAISVNSNQGWTTSAQPNSVTLAPGGSDTVSVVVNIPLNATGGTVDSTTVTASSTTAGTSASDTAVDTTRVECTVTNIDLIVTNITLTPNPPVAGVPTTVEVTIRNQGGQDMDPMNNFYTDFYVDRTPAYLLPGDIEWGVQAQYLTANTSYTLSSSYVFSAGSHQIWAQVDTDNTVDECPFENNNVLGPITIGVTGQQEDTGNDIVPPPPPNTSPRITPTPAFTDER